MSILKKFTTRLLPSHKEIENSPAEQIYRASLALSRRNETYHTFLVPDTLDGRFDMLCVHVVLIIYRIKQIGTKKAKQINQKIFDNFFADMDLTLREMGVGDLGVAKRVRKMSEAFNGRLTAYSQQLDANDRGGLALALARNVGRRETVLINDEALADFIFVISKNLAGISDQMILSGQADLLSCLPVKQSETP